MAAPKTPNIATEWLMRHRQKAQKVKSPWVEAVAISAGTKVGPDSALPPLLETGLPYDKVTSLRSEFIGAPMLCYYNAQLIVCLRRGRSLPTNFNLFNVVWHSYPDALASNLNARWLLSSVDTFADLGAPGQREAALAVSAFVNMARFADSEHFVLDRLTPTKGPVDLASAYRGTDSKQVLWDGIKVYNIIDGDGIQNYLDRMHRTLLLHPPICAIFEQLVARMSENRTMFARLAGANQKFDLTKWTHSVTKRSHS